MSERLHQAIAAYHDGTLDAAGSRLLVAALQGKDGALVRQAMTIDALLAQAFTEDDAVVRSVEERIEAERSASAMVRAVHRSLGARRPVRARRAASLQWLAVAALMLVVVATGWWLGNRSLAMPGEGVCRLQTTAPVTVVRAGVAAPVATGSPLYLRDRLIAGGAATLVWPDGSRIELTIDTQVRLDPPAPGPGLQVDRGTVTAEISPQRPGAPFVIATEEARVEVIGTRFQLAAGTRRTQVDLDHGVVRLTRISDGRTLTLQPQQSAIVAPEVELVARPLLPPSAPLPRPAGEAAWSALFPASGLEGWTAQYGIWSNDHGLVRGNDPHHGKARLISVHAFADIELTCRLRISGAPVAEVQVGDYNWFVEIPAQHDGWIDVRLRQHGEVLTATANGVALSPHAGAGRPARSGPLAFYVLAGGMLEISDAHVRSAP